MLQFIDFNSLENNATSSCQRLFHGRGHAYAGYEHINVDWLAPVVLITLYKEVEADWLQEISNDLMALIPDCSSVQVQYRCRSRAPFEILIGEEISQTIVSENGLNFNIQIGKSQNTGLFLDIKNGRNWVQNHTNNKNILNLFSYTCAFSVAALAGGAKQVVNIDNNKSVLSKGRENHRLNQQDTKKVKFEPVNIFNSWRRVKKYAPFDMLISDPPSFQTGSVNIQRDYKKIIQRIPELMNPNADLMLCLNSPDLSKEFLLETVAEYCPECQFIERIRTPEVYKEAEAGKGLKVLIFRYLTKNA